MGPVLRHRHAQSGRQSVIRCQGLPPQLRLHGQHLLLLLLQTDGLQHCHLMQLPSSFAAAASRRRLGAAQHGVHDEWQWHGDDRRGPGL